MATHAHITPAASPRRVLKATAGTSRRRRARSTPADARTALEAIVTRALAMLAALDAKHADMEPDYDDEAGLAEASAQPVTLSPDCRSAVTHRPSRRATRAAYRLNGDLIPSNLRPFAGLFGGRLA